jgi:hypothetical protein
MEMDTNELRTITLTGADLESVQELQNNMVALKAAYEKTEAGIGVLCGHFRREAGIPSTVQMNLSEDGTTLTEVEAK